MENSNIQYSLSILHYVYLHLKGFNKIHVINMIYYKQFSKLNKYEMKNLKCILRIHKKKQSVIEGLPFLIGWYLFSQNSF